MEPKMTLHVRGDGRASAHEMPPDSGAHSASSRRAAWRIIGVFISLVFVSAWLFAIPMWIFGHETANPIYLFSSTFFMLSPAIVAIGVVYFLEGRPILSSLALNLRGKWRRVLVSIPIAILVAIAISLLTSLSSALLGTYHFDFLNLSNLPAFFAQLGQNLSEDGNMQAAFLQAMAITAPIMLIGGLIGTMGEEIGWHAWLYPRLRELMGIPSAMIITGIVWGLWHAPVILLGHNYPSNPPLGVVMMIGVCILLTGPIQVLMNWAGTVWTAAIMHAAINSYGVVFYFGLQDGARPADALWAGTTGMGGWPAGIAIFLVCLVILKRQERKGEVSS
ncbi:MAG: type II CAAX endopeptidase family protein [Actinomycetaceae bacterium]|nr:type II CAAX endopeptidase family protein [Actinomycetaceae bacterium]